MLERNIRLDGKPEQAQEPGRYHHTQPAAVPVLESDRFHLYGGMEDRETLHPGLPDVGEKGFQTINLFGFGGRLVGHRIQLLAGNRFYFKFPRVVEGRVDTDQYHRLSSRYYTDSNR